MRPVPVLSRRAGQACLLVLLLAACGTPQDRCVRNITRDLDTVSQLVAETELNLSRGFAYETEVRTTRVGVTGCVGRGRYSGVGVRFCGSNEPYTVRRAVPIDPAAEERKLAALRERQAALQAALPRAREACAARFPA